MTVLAVDTSARGRSVAVITTSEGVLVAHRTTRALVSGALIGPVAALLAEHGHELSAVVVAVGPGSYTGVRSGMAAALGVAQAGGIPLHGVGSLEVVAYGSADSIAGGVAVSAAGREAVYIARFARVDGALISDAPARLTAAEWAARRLAGEPEVSLDEERSEPHRALAKAVPAALARPPLDPAGLAAHHVAVAGAQW
jgi:tRNA threonylcarbamoyladenosine biosynthesis protein TsaB